MCNQRGACACVPVRVPVCACVRARVCDTCSKPTQTRRPRQYWLKQTAVAAMSDGRYPINRSPSNMLSSTRYCARCSERRSAGAARIKRSRNVSGVVGPISNRNTFSTTCSIRSTCKPNHTAQISANQTCYQNNQASVSVGDGPWQSAVGAEMLTSRAHTHVHTHIHAQAHMHRHTCTGTRAHTYMRRHTCNVAAADHALPARECMCDQ